MSPKRFLLIPALVLLVYLGIYSWNQRTHVLDAVADHTGLEFVGTVLKATSFVERSIVNTWQKYLNLVDVRAENERLRSQILALRTHRIMTQEDRAELERLRKLLMLAPLEPWRLVAARVLGGRMGANAALNTMIISNGYLSGALPGVPVMTLTGVLGRVFRAGPLTATILLIEDPGHRVAVITQKSRVSGMLEGAGAGKPLELCLVTQDNILEVGEILVSSGLDGMFPKGLPVARITSITAPTVLNFLTILAEPLADLRNAEEVLLIDRHVATQLDMTLPFEPDSFKQVR